MAEALLPDLRDFEHHEVDNHTEVVQRNMETTYETIDISITYKLPTPPRKLPIVHEVLDEIKKNLYVEDFGVAVVFYYVSLGLSRS